MISAKIIADSIANNIRLVTMELNYPRFIHSELMTHRMFSRNAASSRAIPIEKMIDQVRENPAIPIHWGKNQSGMQAKEELDKYSKKVCNMWWTDASKSAIRYSKLLNDIGSHKQVANRLLEPFQWMKVIVTATEWDNFFKLRDHEDAQPEIRELARCMKKAMEESIPQELKHGEWHLPYITTEDCLKTTTDNFVKLSVARCARVSYDNHGKDSIIEKDITLADRLLEAGHMSPFEHVATPMQEWVSDPEWQQGITHMTRDGMKWSGNFRGWIQYRQLLTY